MILGEQPITCRYRISQDDYAVLNAALMHIPKKNTPLVYVRLGMLFVFVAVVIVALKQISVDSWGEIATGFGGGIVGGGVVVFVFRRQLKKLYGRLMSKLHYASDLVDKDDRTLTFSNDGLHVASEKFTGDSPWTAFTSIMRSEEHFIIWQNSRQGHVVPLYAFEEGDVERLWHFFEPMQITKRIRL